MASKVNKKFLIFLLIAVAAGTVLIGGLYVMNVRGSVARNVRLGDEAMAKQDYRAARDHYGRAVNKQPGDLSYLAKLEDATLRIVPKSSSEAAELYRGYLGILSHAARYNSADPQTHKRLLKELTTTARITNAGWNNIEAPAEEMFRRLPESNPERYLGKVYGALGVLRRLRAGSADEVNAAAESAREAVTHLAENDLAHATLILAELAVADKLRETTRTGSIIDEQTQRLHNAIQRARTAVPNGPETARMVLMGLIIARSNDMQRAASAGTSGQPALPSGSVTQQEIDVAASHLATLLTPEADMALIAESADLLAAVASAAPPPSAATEQPESSTDPVGQPESSTTPTPANATTSTFKLSQVVEMLKNAVEAKSDRLTLVQSLAMLQLMIGDLDAAEQSAKTVLDAPALPCSLMSQLQPELRKMAGALLMDLEGRRWAAAKEEDRPAHLARMEAARNRLADLVIDKQNDVALLRADARLAYITKQYSKAAHLYERLVRETRLANDVEILYNAALSLEEINQYGLARERIIQGLQVSPGNAQLLVTKARLELAMGMRAEAANTARMFPADQVAASPELQDIIKAIGTYTSTTDPLETVEQDEAIKTLVKVNLALARGDRELAANELRNAVEANPTDLRLLNAVILLEIQSGNLDAAKQHLEKGMALAPDNSMFRQYDAMFRHDDPVTAMIELHGNVVADEKERLLSILTSLRSMRQSNESLLQQLEATGNPATSATAIETTRKILARIQEEHLRNLQLAQATLGDDPRFIEFLLDEAIAARNWQQAADVVARSKAANADQAGGNFHKGRMELTRAASLAAEGKTNEARDMYREAVRTLEAATDQLGFNSVCWKLLAAAHQGTGNYAQTERALEQAYKNNPNDLEIVRAYFSILLRRGDQVRALRVVRSARQFVPNDTTLRHTWLNLEADVGDRALALRLRRALAVDFPDDLNNALELAKLLSSSDPSRETMIDAKGEPLYSDQRWARMTIEERARAVEQARSDWSKESDALLAKLTERLGNDLRLASLRATVFKDRGDVDGGERQLQAFLDEQTAAGKATAEMWIELARYQGKAAQTAKAIETLRQALPLQDPVNREVDRELGSMLMRLGRYDQALEHLNAVAQAQPDDTRVASQCVEAMVKLKRFDEAQTRLKSITDLQGEDVISILLVASIAQGQGEALLAEGKTAAAEQKFIQQRDAYLRAQALDPANAMPYLLHAQWFVSEYARTQRTTALNDALGVLDTVEKIRSGLPEVSISRVGIFKVMGDQNAAVGELRRLLDRLPDQHNARRELAQIYVQQNRHDDAIALMNEGIRTNPTIGLWHEGLGDLLRVMKQDSAGAFASYSKADAIAPSPMLMAKMMETGLSLETPDCRGLLQRLEARREWLTTHAPLQEQYARVLSCLKRQEDAITALKQAYELRKQAIASASGEEGAVAQSEISQWFKALASVFAMPDVPGMVDASAAEALAMELTGGNPSLWELRSLASVWISSGDMELTRAIEVQTQAIAKCPPEEKELWNQMQGELANLYYAAKRYADAATTYEKMLETNPAQPDVLNNLAYLLADELKNPQKALPLAERALQLARTNAAVLDTAGWVYFLAGDNAKAMEYLRESVRTQRAAGTFLHLAEVQIKTNDINGARQSLDDASRLSPTDPQRTSIQRLAAEIRRISGQGR